MCMCDVTGGGDAGRQMAGWGSLGVRTMNACGSRHAGAPEGLGGCWTMAA